jgi:hypothetical protein
MSEPLADLPPMRMTEVPSGFGNIAAPDVGFGKLGPANTI